MQILHCFGTFWLESVALNKLPGNETVSENVKFEAYLNDGQNSIVADINSEEQKLYISVSVQNEGKLENIKINFEEANFDIKDRTGQYEGDIEALSQAR